MIEKGLAAFLLANTQFLAQCQDRVYPETVPQAVAFPHLVLERSGTERQTLLGGGALPSRGRPTKALVQASAWDLTYQGAKKLADLVRQICDGYKGSMGAFAVQACWVSDDVDNYAPPLQGEGTGVFATAMTLEIWFNE
jgi:hypothetical protein